MTEMIEEYMERVTKGVTNPIEIAKLSVAVTLVEARESAGLTQDELAAKADISARTINFIEKGRNTSVETLAKIAHALGKKISITLE